MNKQTSLKRAVFVALALGVAGATATFADTTSTTDTTTTTNTGTTTPGGGWHHHRHHKSVLTAAERSELKADREKVLAANPTLKTQEETLHQQFKSLKSQNPPATQAQWQALKTQHEALHTQIRAAMVGVDSGASAIFAKIDAAHAAHHHTN